MGECCHKLRMKVKLKVSMERISSFCSFYEYVYIRGIDRILERGEGGGKL